MKKKHRDIVVNGETYGWIAGYEWDEDGTANPGFKIFKNKKEIYRETPKVPTITPAMIAKAIKRLLPLTQEAIDNAKKLGEIDADYIEAGYNRETTGNRLDLLSWFKDNALWDDRLNWLRDDIDLYYSTRKMEIKYPGMDYHTAKWIRCLKYDENLPESEYQACIREFEESEKQCKIDFDRDANMERLRAIIKNHITITK